MRERTRGVVILVAALIGLVAEAVSTIQDGIGGPKVVALACFAFLFWYGWSSRAVAPGRSSRTPSCAEPVGFRCTGSRRFVSRSVSSTARMSREVSGSASARL